ncbi:MAG: hypothetical protein ACYSTF_10325 [Planctomycetota bacterium]
MAVLFSTRERYSDEVFLKDCGIVEPELADIAISVRKAIATLSKVPAECIYANDGLHSELSELPICVDSFAWDDVLTELGELVSFTFSFKDAWSLRAWHESHHSATVRDVVFQVNKLIIEKKLSQLPSR